MATQGAITDFFDIGQAKQQQAEVINLIEQYIATASRVKPVVVGLQASGGAGEMIRETAELNKLLMQNAEIAAKAATAAYKQAQAQERLEAATVRTAKAEQERAKTQILLGNEQRRAEAAADREKKKQEELGNAYAKLSRDYAEAALKAKTYYLTLGSEHETTKKAVASAKEMGDALKAADASVGQHQRNVGNYASGFSALNNSFNQITREAPAFAMNMNTGFMAISNNLPTLFDAIKTTNAGIKSMRAEGKEVPGLMSQLATSFFSWGTALSLGVTLLTIYGADMAKWVAGLFAATKAIDVLKGSQAALNEAMKGSEFKEAVTSVNELTIQVDLAKKGLIDKTEVIDKYNEGIGKTTGQVKTLGEVEEKLVKAGPAFIQMVLYKAAAQKSLDEATGVAIKNAESMFEVEDKLATARSSVKREEAGLAKARAAYAASATAANAAAVKSWEESLRYVRANYNEVKKGTDAEVAAGKLREKESTKVAERLMQNAADIAAANDFSFNSTYSTKDDDKAKKKAEKEAKDREAALKAYEADMAKRLAAQRKAQYEAAKLEQEEIVGVYRATADNEALPGRIRLEARRQEAEEEKALIKLTTDYELAEINARVEADVKATAHEKYSAAEKANVIASIRAAAANERLVIEQKALTLITNAETNAAAEIIAIRQSVAAVDQKEAAALVALTERQTKARVDIEIAAAEEVLRVRESDLSRLAANEKAHNVALYQSGQIDKQTYEANKAKIEADYHRSSLMEQINFYKAILNVVNLGEKERSDATGKLHDLETKLRDSEIKDFEDKEAKKTEIQKQYQEKRKEAAIQLGEELKGLAFDVLTAGVDRELNANQEQIDAIENKKKTEIDAVNATLESAQNKAAQIKIIEAKAGAEREQLEQRGRRLQTERARYERAQTIAGIIQNTSMGIMRTIAEVPKYDYGISTGALVAIYAAIGAAQIARVLATPLPKFGEGTHDSPAGPALLGEKGKSELVIHPDGRIYKTPASPVVANLPAHTVVLPDADRVLNAMAGTAASYGPGVQLAAARGGMSELLLSDELKREFVELRNTIKDKREVHYTFQSPVATWVRNGNSWFGKS